jgi:hypothetical protein
MWKRKRSVDQLYGKDLVDRAQKLDIRFTNISEDCIKSQIRDAEKVQLWKPKLSNREDITDEPRSARSREAIMKKETK